MLPYLEGDAGEDALQVEMSAAERADTALLEQAHLVASDELPRLLDEYGVTAGLSEVQVFLVDLQQRLLVPFNGGRVPQLGISAESLSVDGTLAGRTFQQSQVAVQELDVDRSLYRIWLPLLDGTERVGVLAVTICEAVDVVNDPDALMRARLMRFASLTAELLVSKTMYGDTIVRLRRASAMGLAAELQWSLLPPLSFATASVTIAAGLEPAYEISGDSFDYAVDDGIARIAVFDGMGHGLQSAQLAAMAVAGYRNGRRAGRSLTATARGIEDAINAAFNGDVFTTGLLAELDTASGALQWVNAGHPAPLLVREGRLVKELHLEPVLPFGLSASLGYPMNIVVGNESLQPDDIVIVYSDGVVEARAPSGDFYGVQRLVDLASRNIASGLSASETMRRIVRSLLEHQQGQLQDDATLMLFQWHSP